MAESMSKKKNFPDIPFNLSESFHSTAEGKVWTRLLINLCWWLHDMYEIDSADPNEKFEYIEKKLNYCAELFPAEFQLMFSNPDICPAEQHPLLICRQSEQKIIILVFRATVSTKCIQDVFTDMSIHSNHQVYHGDRHSGFSRRVESGPLLAVTNWLRRGWKVIITGHSLGGAVSQLFTAQVIDKLVEAGLLPVEVKLRCITFGTPQCADHYFWSNYTQWYDMFDTYIYGHDAIFRLATFGATITKQVIDSFSGYIQQLGIKLCAKVISYISNDQTNILARATDQIRAFANDTSVPSYSIFGRHHFIRKNEKSEFTIDSVGELEAEKNQLLKDLVAGDCWYNYLTERKFIPNQFKFIYREFMEHGCYPLSINQLFNQEATLLLRSKRSMKQQLLRLKAKENRVKSSSACCLISNLNAIINFAGELSLYRIYFQGFLADFVRSVKLPIELAESQQFREKTPALSHDRPDECAVLCFQSKLSTRYLQTHLWFEVEVSTYFGSFNVQVVVLSKFDPKIPSVYQLNPIETVLRAYGEFILDAASVERIDSPLSRCFHKFFDALENIEPNEFDSIMARYYAEMQSRNFVLDTSEDLQKLRMPITEAEVNMFFENELVSLKRMAENNKDSEKRQHASFLYQALRQAIQEENLMLSSSVCAADKDLDQNAKLIPLHLDFTKLRRYLHQLHTQFNVRTIQKNLTAMMAPFFFITIKMQRLESLERFKFRESICTNIFSSKVGMIHGTADRTCYFVAPGLGVVDGLASLAASYLIAGGTIMAPFVLLALLGTGCWVGVNVALQFPNPFREVLKSLNQIAASLLASTGETVQENENEWQILNRIAESDWSKELTQVTSPEQCNEIWTRTFRQRPLKDIPAEYRLIFIGVTEMCCQLCAMRQMLAGQPPKIVITGQSQTGKSTLFEHLTGWTLEERYDITNFNTRMSLQCPAFVKLNDKSSNETISGDSVLQINVVDSPGDDDATGQSATLLQLSQNAATLFVVVSTLRDINQQHTIALINKLLATRVKILVLINQVDLRLQDVWDSLNKTNLNRKKDSDDEDLENDNLDLKFNLCETLDTLIERPVKELTNGLTFDQGVIDARVTFQTTILKNFNKFEKTFIQSHKTFVADGFREKVHKSNVNKWIIQNLMNPTNSQHLP